jgi:hypothetical protein
MAKPMDVEQARFNMVEQQIRTWEVLDQGVLDLLFLVRREDFVPPEYRLLAFADLEIPLGDHQKMWAPKMEARVLQELQVAAGESVLEIGTGSGVPDRSPHASRHHGDERRDQPSARGRRQGEARARRHRIGRACRR